MKKMMSPILVSVALGGTLLVDLAAQEPSEVRLVSDDGVRRVEVHVDGELFTAYLYPETLEKPVLFPIRTAAGGAITRGFPLDPQPRERVDHPHHVGLWFNYGDVNGLDFWNNSSAVRPDNAPRMGSVVHRAIGTIEGGKGRGVLEITADWVDHAGSSLLREDTRFEFHATSTVRAIDRITTLTAVDEPVRMHDNKEGLLGLRVARSLEQPSTSPAVFTDSLGVPTTIRVLDNEGVTGHYVSAAGKEGDDVWGTRARWAALHGEVQGESVTIAIFDHPSNVGHPTYWHARGYGLFAANPLGQKEFSQGREVLDFRLDAGGSVTFRHRILILSGTADPGLIEEHYRTFVGGKAL